MTGPPATLTRPCHTRSSAQICRGGVGEVVNPVGGAVSHAAQRADLPRMGPDRRRRDLGRQNRAGPGGSSARAITAGTPAADRPFGVSWRVIPSRYLDPACTPDPTMVSRVNRAVLTIRTLNVAAFEAVTA